MHTEAHNSCVLALWCCLCKYVLIGFSDLVFPRWSTSVDRPLSFLSKVMKCLTDLVHYLNLRWVQLWNIYMVTTNYLFKMLLSIRLKSHGTWSSRILGLVVLIFWNCRVVTSLWASCTLTKLNNKPPQYKGWGTCSLPTPQPCSPTRSLF